MAARTTRSGSGRSTPGTTSTGCCTTDDLVSGDNVFFVATGITDGELLRGVRYRGGGRATTSVAGHAVASRHDPADRLEHRLTKLRAYSAIDFDRAS